MATMMWGRRGGYNSKVDIFRFSNPKIVNGNQPFFEIARFNKIEEPLA